MRNNDAKQLRDCLLKHLEGASDGLKEAIGEVSEEELKYPERKDAKPSNFTYLGPSELDFPLNEKDLPE